MKPSLNRTIFKLVVDGIELRAAFEERENKQKNAKFFNEIIELSFFSHKIALCSVYKHKCLVTMFTNKDFYEFFQLCLLLSPFQNYNYMYIFGLLLTLRIL